MALCGGVSAILTPDSMTGLSKAGMASLTGLCHTFTDKADGYVRGEGCGVLIIKQLDQVHQRTSWNRTVTDRHYMVISNNRR